VDLRVVAKESYGAALHYFTGSKAHNIAIRRIAQKTGLKINEYGVFRGNKRVAGDTEESVFRSVGLPFIPPELRELAQAARDRGFEYLAITEHSRRLTVAHGLDPQRLMRQCDEIDELNEELKGITLLKGIEVDILEDGSLDLPDEVLGRLDLVVGAVHSKFDLSRAKQTERILRAMEHPHFTLLAHPTGRLLEQRAPYDVDMPRVIRQAKQRGCFLELDAQPDRLDLLDTQCQMAKEEGVLVSIDSDAHSTLDFANLRYGVGQARRGWLEKRDVLNTRTLKELRTLLKKTM
jgi:DNA polymerase (family 10)